MKRNLNKILALVLTFCMLIAQMSVIALADESNPAVDLSEIVEKVKVNGNKTATKLDKDMNSDVTLTLPGEVETLGVDIVYILGGFLSEDAVRANATINALKDTISEIVSQGTYVNFGIAPFSSTEDPVLPLTKFDSAEDMENFYSLVAQAIEDAGNVYDGVNMENAIITAKAMFSQSEHASRPDRQHLVIVSSGNTYFFNSGENNEYVSTVPVNFYSISKKTLSSNALFYTEKAWTYARNANNNSYPIPKAIVDEYNANTDKYESVWDCYWYYIDMWARADVAAGDNFVYKATTTKAADFKTWFQRYTEHSDQTYFRYRSYGYIIPEATQADIDNSVKIVPGANPLTDASAAHAVGNERAMWEAYNTITSEIVDAGINFYPIYSMLRVDGSTTNGNWCPTSYNISWTNQYIGHSFMNMLAGGEAVTFNENKTYFDPIKNEILYLVSAGSTVTDYIGYDADEKEGYNFDFVDAVENLTLKVGDKTYIAEKLATATEGATSTYTFKATAESEATFILDYYYGNGTTEEYFVWTLNENISKFRQVSLTYRVNLVEKSEIIGTHTANTNIEAYLIPIDSDGESGEKEYFPIPEVEYEIEAPKYYTVTVNYYDLETNEEISESYTTSALEGTEYDVIAKDAITIEEYIYAYTTGDTLSGTLNEDKVINVYYGKVVDEIPDEDTPEGGNPNTGDESFIFVVTAAASVLGVAALPKLRKKEND